MKPGGAPHSNIAKMGVTCGSKLGVQGTADFVVWSTNWGLKDLQKLARSTSKRPSSEVCPIMRHGMYVANQWYHFGVGAPPILVYFGGDWDVHWGYGVLTRGHMSMNLTWGPFASVLTFTAMSHGQHTRRGE